MKQQGKRIGTLMLVFVLTLAMYPVSVQAKEKACALGNSLTNQFLGSETCEYDGRIYYGYGDRVYSVKKDGTGRSTVYTMKNSGDCVGFRHVVVYESYIYALFDFYEGVDSSNLQLVRIKLDGSDYKNYGSARMFSIVDDKIYYLKAKIRANNSYYNTYMETVGIYVMKLDGTNEKALIKGSGSELRGTDGNYLYYSQYHAKTDRRDFYRCDMNGKNRTRLLKDMENIAVSGNDLYYSKKNTRPLKNGGLEYLTDIYRKDIHDKTAEKIYTCKGSIVNFYVSGKNLYISDYERGLIRVTISTGKAKVLNKHTGAGICGVHDNILVYAQLRTDVKNNTNVDMILAKASTGKKIKKIGAYFVS